MQTTRTEPLERRQRPSSESEPRSRFPRRMLFFVAVGLAVLAASVVGTAKALHTHTSDARATAAAGEPKDAVGFGFVDVEGRVASLSPLQSGRVSVILVRENQPVKKGDKLLQLDNSLAQAKVEEAEADLGAAEESLAAAKDVPLQQKEQIAGQEQVVKAAEFELAAGRKRLAKAERLWKTGVSPVSKEDYQAAQQQVKQLEAAVAAQKAKLRGLRLRKPEVLIARAKRQVAGKQAQLKQAKEVRDQFTLRAPADGTILRISTSIGDLLGPARPEPAMIFCPNTRRIIRAEIEQESAGNVKVGMPAVIQDDSRLDRKWKGKVKSISDWYSHRRSLLLEPRQFNDVRTLECIIEMSPGHPHVRIGQRVRVVLGK